jgi:hypothetical protein
MDPHQAAIETEAARLCGVFARIGSLARERGLDLLMAGAQGVREGTVAPEDWRRVREAIRRVGDGAAGRPGAAASGSSGFGPGTPPPGNTSPSPE